jgi:hypothetical protein
MNYQHLPESATSAWELGEVKLLIELGACELGETVDCIPWAAFASGFSVSRVRGRYWLGDAEGRVRSVSKARTRKELQTLARMAGRRFCVA